ncbi:BTAD domain-containing putative transcriptional regulator [Amycolatopsis sp. NPDC051061]|uniref:BTAD domain-containing putative transcriptional regulator n=1 Tax=Amycolatopsis sp. NPDC051061 TaxID=3155042 RepID=UPI00342C17EB
MRTALRILAGFAAISVLLAGPPAALWKFRTAYLPDQLADVAGWLTTRDDGSLFLMLLTSVGVVAWLQLVVAFGVEVAANLRGARALRLPGFGWAQRLAAGVLLLVLTGTATAEAAEAPPHVVVPGDNLSSIAAAELGSPARYREIYELNRGVQQPDGRALREPGLVKPGWVLKLPGAAAEDEVTVRDGQTLSEIARDRLGDAHRYQEIFDLNRDRPQSFGHPLTSPDRLHPGDVLRLPNREPKPRPSEPAVPPHTPAAPRPAAAVPPVASAPTEAAPAAEYGGVPPALLAGAGGVVVASLLLLMSARRGRAGRPDVLEPPTVTQLDHALRTMARNARRAGVALPAVVGVSIGAKEIRLRLARPAEAIRPFTAESGTEWLLAEQPGGTDESPAPYSAMVALGHTADRDLVLANLEQAGLITIRGDSEDVHSVLAAMTRDLITASWTGDLVVVLVGTGKHTADCDGDRVRFTESWSEAAGAVAADPRRSAILSACPLDYDQLGDLGKLEEQVAAIVTAVADNETIPGAWTLDASAGHTFVDELGLDIELQRFTPEQPSQLAVEHDDLESAADLPEPEPMRLQADVAPSPAIRLLGPVTLVGVDPEAVEAKKINRLTELAAFLSLHPGVTADEISRQLGTDTNPWSAATRQGYISRLRTWLGRDADGELYLPNVDAGRGGYRLSDSFETDWDQFRDLSHRGLVNPETSTEELQQAMALVTGPPLSNVPQGRYAWSSWIQREMIDSIVEVAHALGAARLKSGDLSAARRATVRGLQVDPVSELLHRDLLRVEYRTGNTAAVREIADRLSSQARALAIALEDETVELVDSLAR